MNNDQPITDVQNSRYRKDHHPRTAAYFAMFGATILVPILTGLSIPTTLLMAGLGTPSCSTL